MAADDPRTTGRSRDSAISATLEALRRRDRPHGQGGSGDATEASIMTATERLLATTPLHQLSVTDIVREAKISRGTFYFWFSSKFAVVIALLAEAMDEMYDASLPIMSHPEGASYDDALRTGVRAAAEVWERHRFVLRAAVQHWHNDREIRTVLFDIVDWLSTALGELISRGRAEGAMGPGPPANELAATLIWSSQYCLYIADLQDDQPDAYNTTTETLAWLWTKTLAPGAEFARGEG
jgi:TetR/AcrR family transcriptional regulator, ethionamide resistance regulator